MKIAYITAGAAGMYCGSCLRDNTLVTALRAQGHDALLIPTYTPLRTDEPDASTGRVFFGALNVVLQEKFGLFRHTPWFVDRLLDAPRLLRWLGRFAGKTQPADVAGLTLSILRGKHGHQKKEVEKLTRWLRDEIQPDVVVLTNVLLSGLIPPLKAALDKPIIAMLQGDDSFLEGLPQATRDQACTLIRENGASCDGYIATCTAYADFMSGYLGLPRERIDVVYPGIKLDGYAPEPIRPAGRPVTIGFFARICPEKGFHVLVDAFCHLKRETPALPVHLEVAGWLGELNKSYLEQQEKKLADAGLLDSYRHVDCPSHADKQKFLRGLDILSVPTSYLEPKGLYLLEAWATGVPVVQPRHGSFPELIEATGGGLLVHPNDPVDLARGLRRLIENREEAIALGHRGMNSVREKFNAAVMATETVRALHRLVPAIRGVSEPRP